MNSDEHPLKALIMWVLQMMIKLILNFNFYLVIWFFYYIFSCEIINN